jgi:SAM-dependent methyltransferase
MEKQLQARGLRVAAIPLDPVIAAGPAADGIEMIYGDIDAVEPRHCGAYDCILCLNLLHLARDPQKLLQQLPWFMHEGSVAVIQMPNMRSLRAFRSYLRAAKQSKWSDDYQAFGVHFVSTRKLRKWCVSAGLQVDEVLAIPARRGDGLFGMTSVLAGLMPKVLSFPLSESIVVIASRAARKDGFAAERVPITGRFGPPSGP